MRRMGKIIRLERGWIEFRHQPIEGGWKKVDGGKWVCLCVCVCSGEPTLVCSEPLGMIGAGVGAHT